VAAWFGEAELKAGETRRSEMIPLPAGEAADGPLLFKVAATDAAGNLVAAWALHEPMASRP
jgi:hypothetical protein